jgi:hypothetical protein
MLSLGDCTIHSDSGDEPNCLCGGVPVIVYNSSIQDYDQRTGFDDDTGIVQFVDR